MEMKQIDKKIKVNLKSSSMISTRQRSIIMEVLKGTTIHPTADWIYDRVRKKCPNISLGTVYRNLNMLKGKGLIRELKFGKNTALYDGNFEPHHHIFCLECGKLEDIQCKVHPNLAKSVEKSNGYKIVNHHLKFNGICPDCLKGGNININRREHRGKQTAKTQKGNMFKFPITY